GRLAAAGRADEHENALADVQPPRRGPEVLRDLRDRVVDAEELVAEETVAAPAADLGDAGGLDHVVYELVRETGEARVPLDTGQVGLKGQLLGELPGFVLDRLQQLARAHRLPSVVGRRAGTGAALLVPIRARSLR